MVFSQTMTHLTLASTGVYYIKCQKQKLPDHQCLSSTKNGEKPVGESAHPFKQDRWQALWNQNSGSPRPILSSNRGKGSCYAEETKKEKNNLKGKKRQHSPVTAALALHVHFKWCGLQDVAFCTETMWKVITKASNYWRLPQSCYHTCSEQEGDRPWVRIATKDQGLGFMSCSQDISPIYSCAGCCPLLPTPWCKALLTTNPQPYFVRAQGAAPSVVSSPSSCWFGKTLALLMPSLWGQLQKHTALCSGVGPTAGSWHSQHCSAYKVWHVPRSSLRLHSAKPYTFLQTHTCVSSSSRIRRQDPTDTGGSNFLWHEF